MIIICKVLKNLADFAVVFCPCWFPAPPLYMPSIHAEGAAQPLKAHFDWIYGNHWAPGGCMESTYTCTEGLEREAVWGGKLPIRRVYYCLKQRVQTQKITR